MSTDPTEDASPEIPAANESGIRRKRKRTRKAMSVEKGFGKQKERRSSSAWMWRVIPLAAVAAVVGVTCYLLLPRHGSAEKKVIALSGPQMVSMDTPPIPWHGMKPEEIAQRFLDAPTHEQRLEWVWQPQVVSPLMKRFYEEGAGRSEEVAAVKSIGDATSAGVLYARFAVTMKDESKRLLCVRFDEKERASVDFKCYSRYCSRTWESLLTTASVEPDTVRLSLEIAYDFKELTDEGEFGNEEDFARFLGTSPELKNPVYLYALRKDPFVEELLNLPPSGPTRYTLQIKSSERSHEFRQFLIQRVVCPGWLEPAPAPPPAP